jgi:hypothetical protein
MSARLRVSIAILGALLLAGACASVPRGSDRLERLARSFTPPPGKANVYAVRTWSALESGIAWPVTLDFREFGHVGQRSYLYGAVPVGDHVLGVSLPGPVPTRVRFAAEAGRNYFFKLAPMSGWPTGVIRIEPLDEAAGRALIETSAPSADNRFEYEQ